jgi:predicted negative regulator of RcsB-dependent stress response
MKQFFIDNKKFLMGIFIVIMAGLVGYGSYLWLGPDNAIEEACEEMIQAETGIDVDLSHEHDATVAK